LSLAQFSSIDPKSFDLISVDLFDTLLLRDYSVQRSRFLEVAKTLSKTLQASGCQFSSGTLLGLRRRIHQVAYQAVSVEGLNGDAALARMIETQLALLGLDRSAASLFLAAELEVETRRLKPNLPLVRLLSALRESGKRVIAISDTYFSKENLELLVGRTVGNSPIERIYASCDLGLTKHSGLVFSEVAKLEKVTLPRLLHCGDDAHADLAMPRAAGCQAVLLPRPAWVLFLRHLSALRSLCESLAHR